jgi:hypothetical protein
MHQIGATDDANHPPIMHDGKAVDVPTPHQFNKLLQRIVLGNGVRLGRHDLFDLAARRMHVFVGKPARADDEFEPSGAAALRSKFAARRKSPSVTMPTSLPSLLTTGRPLM